MKKMTRTAAVATPLRLHQPAEWETQRVVWTAYPNGKALWHDDLAAAQQACLAMCRALAKKQQVRLLVRQAAELREVQSALGDAWVDVLHVAFGDIWLRDSAPLFVRDATGLPAAVCFGFNGWGGKFWYDEDKSLNRRIAAIATREHNVSRRDFSMILEGGSIDADGEGTLLTTRQCLRHRNRNPWLDEAKIEAILATALGAQKVLWLEAGLLQDHTDGHVDNVVRFVGPGHVVCMLATDSNDLNAKLLRDIAARLRTMTDARGRRLRVTTLPSPGAVYNDHHGLLSASYMNFVIGNHSVVLPTYDRPADDEALRVLRDVFVGRDVVGINAHAILTGGGSFHCMTQPQFV